MKVTNNGLRCAGCTARCSVGQCVQGVRGLKACALMCLLQVVPRLPLSGRWSGCSCFCFKRRKLCEADEHALKTVSANELFEGGGGGGALLQTSLCLLLVLLCHDVPGPLWLLLHVQEDSIDGRTYIHPPLPSFLHQKPFAWCSVFILLCLAATPGPGSRDPTLLHWSGVAAGATRGHSLPAAH